MSVCDLEVMSVPSISSIIRNAEVLERVRTNLKTRNKRNECRCDEV